MIFFPFLNEILIILFLVGVLVCYVVSMVRELFSCGVRFLLVFYIDCEKWQLVNEGK